MSETACLIASMSENFGIDVPFGINSKVSLSISARVSGL